MFDMLLNKCSCHIANMTHTAFMLPGNIDSTLLHIPNKIQLTATATSDIVAKYVQETNMPLKCHIYQLHYVQISENSVSTTHHNQKCLHRHWYTYISHYWHMSLNKYASHIAQECSTAQIV